MNNMNVRYGTKIVKKWKIWKGLHTTYLLWDSQQERTSRGEPIERKKLVGGSEAERSDEREPTGGRAEKAPTREFTGEASLTSHTYRYFCECNKEKIRK